MRLVRMFHFYNPCEQITPSELKKKLQSGADLKVLDVREPFEVAQSKIEGAINIPLNQLQAHLDEIPKDKEIVTVCRSGARSMHACIFLKKMGFNVKNMIGGMMSW